MTRRGSIEKTKIGAKQKSETIGTKFKLEATKINSIGEKESEQRRII